MSCAPHPADVCHCPVCAHDVHRAAALKLRPWPGEAFCIGECPHCITNTLSWPAKVGTTERDTNMSMIEERFDYGPEDFGGSDY